MAEPSFQGFCHGYIIITLILFGSKFTITNNYRYDIK